MRKSIIAAALLMLLSLPAMAGGEDEIRDSENAFAKAFADRDVPRFASFIAPDATFIVNGKSVTGADAVVKAWSGFLEGAKPPFSWRSEHTFVDASGTSAMSVGSVFDPDNVRIATFTSFWRKENGAWKVVFDGPGAPVCRDKK